MHTVRNRLSQTSRKGAKGPGSRSSREDVAFMLRNGAQPPGFPSDLIVPPHRGAVITAAAWPPATIPPQTPLPAPHQPGISRKSAKKAARRAAARARAEALADPVNVTATPVEATLDPEPYPDQPPVPVLRSEPECPPALVLPPEPDAPVPATRALAIRRQGFIDILAFALRDSGRRLSRWSSARRRADDMKEKLAKAEARMRAMEAQLAALQALQERVRQAG